MKLILRRVILSIFKGFTYVSNSTNTHPRIQEALISLTYYTNSKRLFTTITECTAGL